MLADLDDLRVPSLRGGYTLGSYLSKSCRVARSSEGQISVVLTLSKESAAAPRRLESLRYDPARELEVVGEDGVTRREVLAAIVCLSPDVGIQQIFLRIVRAVFGDSLPSLSEDVIETRIDELVRLFRALSKPGDRTVQGLWTELAIVAWSCDPSYTLSAWHSSPRALHDFAAGAFRLEVKSCGRALREHRMRFEQLAEGAGGRTLLASLIVEESDEGATVGDLVALVLTRLGGSAEAEIRLDGIVIRSLGSDWREGAVRRFDLEGARESLLFFDVRAVPSVGRTLPVEVKDVEFTVDFSTTDAIELDAARALAPFFGSVLPEGDT